MRGALVLLKALLKALLGALLGVTEGGGCTARWLSRSRGKTVGQQRRRRG